MSMCDILKGARMIGELDRSGVGVACDIDKVSNIAELKASCRVSNAALLRELRENDDADKIFDITCSDASLGRMSAPKSVDEVGVMSFAVKCLVESDV